MDTIAASILSSEIPIDKSKDKDLFYEPGYTSILDQTSPFDVNKQQIFTPMMKLYITGSTIYQQSVLTYIYYYGYGWFSDEDRSGPSTWHKMQFYEGEDHIPTQKLNDFTFIYQVFFMMQFFNFASARFTYEKTANPFHKAI
jgi:hypothetical protein